MLGVKEEEICEFKTYKEGHEMRHKSDIKVYRALTIYVGKTKTAWVALE